MITVSSLWVSVCTACRAQVFTKTGGYSWRADGHVIYPNLGNMIHEVHAYLSQVIVCVCARAGGGGAHACCVCCVCCVCACVHAVDIARMHKCMRERDRKGAERERERDRQSSFCHGAGMTSNDTSGALIKTPSSCTRCHHQRKQGLVLPPQRPNAKSNPLGPDDD